MNLYRQGVGANIGADTISHEQWAKENGALQLALKTRTNTFPKVFNEVQAAQMLEAAVLYGKAALAKYVGFINLAGLNSNAMQYAINAADDASKKWRSKIPWLGSNAFPYTQGKNKEWDEVKSQVIRIYVEAAGLIGQRITIDEAFREFGRDLNPVSPINITKILLIAAACTGATVLILRK